MILLADIMMLYRQILTVINKFAGDLTPEGEKLRPPSNHFDVEATDARLRPPKGHDINKIYISPSIRYAGHQVYAPRVKYVYRY